jgi:hypothetical protein
MISPTLVDIVAEPRDGDVARQPAQVKCSLDPNASNHLRAPSPMAERLLERVH